MLLFSILSWRRLHKIELENFSKQFGKVIPLYLLRRSLAPDL